MKIYLVEGSSGEWSDRKYGASRPTQTKKNAEERILRLEDILRKYKANIGNPKDHLDEEIDEYDWFEGSRKSWQIFIDELSDPLFRSSYTGTRYYLLEVELFE